MTKKPSIKAGMGVTVVSLPRKDAARRTLPGPRSMGRLGRPRASDAGVIDPANRGRAAARLVHRHVQLKLNIGVSRKPGTPGYGSIGASCGLVLEFDADLLARDLEALHEPAYAAACRAVGEDPPRRLELERQATQSGSSEPPQVRRALPPTEAARPRRRPSCG